MSLNFFTIPALNPQPAQNALNDFCAAQRVVSVDRQFVAAGADSFWAVCVTVAPGTGPLPAALKAAQRRSGADNEGAGSVRINFQQPVARKERSALRESVTRMRLVVLRNEQTMRGISVGNYRSRNTLRSLRATISTVCAVAANRKAPRAPVVAALHLPRRTLPGWPSLVGIM